MIRAWLSLMLGLVLCDGGAARAQEPASGDGPADEEVVSVEGGESVVAEEAATSVVPDPSTPPSRAYQLYWELDLPIVTIGGVLAAGRMIRSHGSAEPAYCILSAMEERGEAICETEGLLFIDEPVAGRWNPTWSMLSDVTVVALGVAPALLLGLDGSLLDAVNDVVVILEAALLATALAALSTKGTGRARPFAYGDQAPIEERLGGDSALSFFSGHTAFAFAAATATFWTVQRRHPEGSLRWLVLASGYALAALTGVARIMAGKHFPTDVLAGAAVGIATGTVIPVLHDTPVAVSASTDRRAATVLLQHAF